MPTERHTVELTRNFERNLDDVERFLEENDATSAFDLLLDELTDTVIPNLESFPKMGRPFLDCPALSVEAASRVEKLRTQLDGLGSRLERALTRQTVQGGYRARLQGVQMELATAVREQLRAEHLVLSDARQVMQQAVRERLVQARHRLQVAEHALRLLDPAQALARGYALLQDEDGHVIRQRAQFRAGRPVRATVSDGSVMLTPVARQGSLDEGHLL